MGTVAVDLDGTILEKVGHPHYGAPRNGAIAALSALRSSGERVIVHACREDEHEVRAVLDHWGVPYDGIVSDSLSLGEHPFYGNQWVKGDVEGEHEVDGIKYDSKEGVGSSPDNANIKYLGYVTAMTPDEFLGVNTKRINDDGVDYFEQQVREGKPLGPPSITGIYDPDTGEITVRGHEGRGRAMAIARVNHRARMPVQVQLRRKGDGTTYEMRSRHLTDEMKRATIRPDKGRVNGSTARQSLTLGDKPGHPFRGNQYHGTSSDALDSIFKEGLKPPADTSDRTFDEEDFYKGFRGKGVFVSSDNGMAVEYAVNALNSASHGAKPVVLKISVPKGTKMKKDDADDYLRWQAEQGGRKGAYEGRSHVIGKVPPEWIESVDYVDDKGNVEKTVKNPKFKALKLSNPEGHNQYTENGSEWVRSWTFGREGKPSDKIDKPSDRTLRQLSVARPAQPMVLYRSHVEGKSHGEYESWTTDREFADSLTEEGSGRATLMRTVDPSEMVYSSNHLPDEMKDSALPGEVVVAHGKAAKRMASLRGEVLRRGQLTNGDLRLSNPEGHNQYTGVDGSTRPRRQGKSRQAKWYAANREARFQRRFGLDAKTRQAEIDEREVMRRALSLSGDVEGHPFRGNQYTSGLKAADFGMPPTNTDPAPGGKYYYHGTAVKNLESIASEGITHTSREGTISLAPHLESVDYWSNAATGGEGKVAILRVSSRKVRVHNFEEDEYDPSNETAETATYQPIARDDLEVWHGGKWKPLAELAGKKLELSGDLPGHPFRGNQYSGTSKPLRVAKTWDKVRESKLYGNLTRKAALIAPDDKLYSVHQAGKSALHEDLMDRNPKAFGIEDRGDDTPADMMEKAYARGLIRVSHDPGGGHVNLTLDGGVRSPDDVVRLVEEGKLPDGQFNVEYGANQFRMGLTTSTMRGKTWDTARAPRPSYLSFAMVFSNPEGHNQYTDNLKGKDLGEIADYVDAQYIDDFKDEHIKDVQRLTPADKKEIEREAKDLNDEYGEDFIETARGHERLNGKAHYGGCVIKSVHGVKGILLPSDMFIVTDGRVPRGNTYGGMRRRFTSFEAAFDQM